MCRAHLLSPLAIDFLEAKGCRSEYPLDRLEEESLRLSIRLSAEQLTAIASLWHVKYLSRCSFQSPRYEILFFDAYPEESVYEFLQRRAFAPPSGGLGIVADCDTDEMHNPEGLVMGPSGALGITDTEGLRVVYRSAFMVVERDAFLESAGAEYSGDICLKTAVSPEDVGQRLHVASLYEPMHDELNALWHAEKSVFLYQGWPGFYFRHLPFEMPWQSVLRVFNGSSQTFADAVARLDGLVHSASEIAR